MAGGEKKGKVKKTANKKGIGIQAKLLLLILPIIFIGMNILSLVSGNISSKAILNQTDKYMNAEIKANSESIDKCLETVRVTAENLSVMVGSTYDVTDIPNYRETFSNIVLSNDLILGSGIWFEPNVYKGDPEYANQEYVGPYWYKDGSEVVEDWEYSNAEYDYFSQEYYLNAKAQTKLASVITDPYYDAASDSIMASCSAPIFSGEGAYIGCITVDISLDTISDIAAAIKTGETGKAMLLTSDGTYIYTESSDKVANSMNISSDTDPVGNIASAVLSGQSGTTEYTEANGGVRKVYFTTIPEVNWKLLTSMDNAEINSAANNMMKVTIPLCVIVILASILVVFFVSRSIARSIVKVNDFAVELADGNFTVVDLDISSKDEIGSMSDSLNNMFHSNHKIISDISVESSHINDASSTLGAMSEQLSAEFNHIESNMAGVNEAMMSSSAATEEVSASVAEVNNSIERLAEQSEEISREVKEISERAVKIQQDSRKSYDSTIAIVNERESELKEATAKAEVVSEIANMANAISNIASEIDLLSLNASIEAARAGEAGRGFAVVASQINKLATETAEAVLKIQETVNSVQTAFTDLADGSNKLLEFVTETVTPDYAKFNEVGRQYGEDADLFGEFSEQIMEMSSSIRNTMNEVNIAVTNIAESTQDTAERSASVNDSVSSVSEAVESVAQLATEQQATAGTLADIVSNFKLQ